jgi:hypothetical protein
VVVWAAVLFWVARQIGPLSTAGILGVVLIAVSIRVGMVFTHALQDRWTEGEADRCTRPQSEVWSKTAACYLVGLMAALALSLAVALVLAMVQWALSE